MSEHPIQADDAAHIGLILQGRRRSLLTQMADDIGRLEARVRLDLMRIYFAGRREP